MSRPRLKVVGPHSLHGQHRHRIAWGTVTIIDRCPVVEAWTEAEWSAMPPAERPPNAYLVPGVGWLCLTWRAEDDDEYREVQAEYWAAFHEWEGRREMGMRTT